MKRILNRQRRNDKKKRTSKVFTLALAVVMMLSMTLMLTSCGAPATLEEYVAENTELQEKIDTMANSQQGMTVEIKENQIIYTYTLPQQIEEDLLDAAKEQFEETMASMAPTFEGVAAGCEEETEISGITVKVTYLNNDGTEIYSQEYSAK